MSQTELANLLDVDVSTVAKIETGDRAASIFTIIEISNRLRVSTAFLLKGLLSETTDPELAVALAARHPELATQPSYRAERTDTGRTGGRFRPPRRWQDGNHQS